MCTPFIKLMRDAAYLRHDWLVTLMHGHDPYQCHVELRRHREFVDRVYGPLFAVAG